MIAIAPGSGVVHKYVMHGWKVEASPRAFGKYSSADPSLSCNEGRTYAILDKLAWMHHRHSKRPRKYFKLPEE